MNIMVWLYQAWQTIYDWGVSIFDFMTSPASDLLFTNNTVVKLWNFMGVEAPQTSNIVGTWLLSLLPDVTMFELLIGGGCGVVLGYIFITWVLNLVT